MLRASCVVLHASSCVVVSRRASSCVVRRVLCAVRSCNVRLASCVVSSASCFVRCASCFMHRRVSLCVVVRRRASCIVRRASCCGTSQHSSKLTSHFRFKSVQTLSPKYNVGFAGSRRIVNVEAPGWEWRQPAVREASRTAVRHEAPSSADASRATCPVQHCIRGGRGEGPHSSST